VKDASTQSWCIPGNVSLTCLSSTTCKTQCYTDSDCMWGYYCDGSTTPAMCSPRKDSGKDFNYVYCSRAMECTSGACGGSYANPTLAHCLDCAGSYSCMLGTNGFYKQSCGGTVFDEPSCVTCDPTYTTCNTDGSIQCTAATAATVCPPNAPDCSGGRCACGAGIPCSHPGEICMSGQCKMAGGFPCINSTDCAYGTCSSGVCPPTPSGGLCTHLLVPNECTNGNCAYVSNYSASSKCP
jgi:hypothetical protein